MLHRTEEFKSKIWKKSTKSEDKDTQDYWKNILISFGTIENAVLNFNNYDIDPHMTIGCGKLIVMELWTILQLIKILGLSIENFNEAFPDLRQLRNSYAHIDERIKWEISEYNKPKVKLKYQAWSIPDKIIKKDNSYNIDAKRIFNIEFSWDKWLMTVFWFIDEYLMCNSDQEILILKIDESLLEELIALIDSNL